MAKNGPTPKRVPHSKHLEALMDVEQPIITDLEWDPDKPLLVNSCSGHSHDHANDCSGSCIKKALDEMDVKIENEKREWLRMGIQPDSNQLNAEVRIQTVISLLNDKLGVSTKEFDEKFKVIMLEVMSSIRVHNEAVIKSARLRSKIHLPGGPLQ